LQGIVIRLLVNVCFPPLIAVPNADNLLEMTAEDGFWETAGVLDMRSQSGRSTAR
jgi:hypothetical protein